MLGRCSSPRGGYTAPIADSNAPSMPSTEQEPPVSGGRQLVVSMCGRSCKFDPESVQTLEDLQSGLQHKLQMEGQSFNMFDVNGDALTTDQQMMDAMRSGLTPFCATLVDESIHYIETRREALAQMQWKVVRDQMASVAGKIASVSRQVSELQYEFGVHKRQAEASQERVNKELAQVLLEERSISCAELRQLHEQLNSVAQFVQMDLSSSPIHTDISAPRVDRRPGEGVLLPCISDSNPTHCLLDLQARIDAERCAREDLACKQEEGVSQLGDQISAASSKISDMLRDQTLAFQKSSAELRHVVEQQGQQLKELRAHVDSIVNDTRRRFESLEDQSSSMATLLSEQGQYQRDLGRRIAELLEMGLLEREQGIRELLDEVLRRMNLMNSDSAERRGVGSVPAPKPSDLICGAFNTPRLQLQHHLVPMKSASNLPPHKPQPQQTQPNLDSSHLQSTQTSTSPIPSQGKVQSKPQPTQSHLSMHTTGSTSLTSTSSTTNTNLTRRSLGGSGSSASSTLPGGSSVSSSSNSRHGPPPSIQCATTLGQTGTLHAASIKRSSSAGTPRADCGFVRSPTASCHFKRPGPDGPVVNEFYNPEPPQTEPPVDPDT